MRTRPRTESLIADPRDGLKVTHVNLDVAMPPQTKVRWFCFKPDVKVLADNIAYVEHQLWFDARKEGAILLGCCIHELICVRYPLQLPLLMAQGYARPKAQINE